MTLEMIGMATSTFIREDLDKIGLNPRARRTMETLPQNTNDVVTSINDTRTELNTVEGSDFVVWQAPLGSKLTNVRLLSGTSNIAISVSTSSITADLTDTGVTAGSYGDIKHLVILAIDGKGRVTSASQVALNSDNVTEGTTNLFFTNARARAAISGSGQISYNNTTGAIGSTGFSGTGTYTHFTFVNGICTAAS